MNNSSKSVTDKLIYGLIIAFLLIGFNPQRGNAFDPANTKIVYVGGSGDYYSNITDAVAAAWDHNTIIIYPGAYTDTDVEIDSMLTFIGIGEVYWSASDTLFVLGADDVTFEGISFKVTGSVDLAVMGAYRYVMENCTLRCRTFDFGQDTSHWISCHLYPKSADGWEITGSNTMVQMRDCKMGDDIPGPDEPVYCLNITDEAMLSAYYSNFYSTESKAIYCDDSRVRLYYCMLIGNVGAAVEAEGNSNLSCLYTSFEGDDGGTPAINIEDHTTAHLNKCIIRNRAESGDHKSLYTKTTENSSLIDNNFEGQIHLDEPAAAASGDIEFYGFNSTTEGGITDESGDKKFGNVVNMHAYGFDAFSGDNATKTITVNGMPNNAIIQITPTGGTLDIGDAMSVVIHISGGRFTVYRSASNNTDDLGFNWTAEWEE
ncbi:MAG: hypothetical protein HQ591_02695 [candidate division Zixibacteria bacterium]|nr:hypothetical protein [Candidatus Tariuqbacter arcticus]